jgi:hypothetical protein
MSSVGTEWSVLQIRPSSRIVRDFSPPSLANRSIPKFFDPLTFPTIRAIVQETFAALLLAQQPDYYKRIQELQKIDLRI